MNTANAHEALLSEFTTLPVCPLCVIAVAKMTSEEAFLYGQSTALVAANKIRDSRPLIDGAVTSIRAKLCPKHTVDLRGISAETQRKLFE